MKTKLSTKGQVVLPGPIRRKLGLQSGDSFEAKIVDGHIALIPAKRKSRRSKIIRDPVTGWPVLTAGPNAPELTHRQVQEILADFP